MSGLRLVNEVPDALTRLVRCIVSGFCSVECSLVMDLLIHHPGIKEDDLLEITKFDKKQLRSIVTTLKQDQFIHSRIQMETGSDGKATRHNYYFINYSIFVNVVKYKLDQVRRKIETMERDMTIRASFRCPRCHKTFTDLETGQLFDSATQTYNCTYCLTEVEEEVYDKNHFDSRTLMAKFNEQMEPFYDLLRELDGIKLSDTLLDPPLIKDAKTNNRSSCLTRTNAEKSTWSGDSTKYFGFGSSEKNVFISDKNHEMDQTRKVFETPAWIKQSTVYISNGSSPMSELLPSSMNLEAHFTTKANHIGSNEDIMKTLLSHEKSSIEKNSEMMPEVEKKIQLFQELDDENDAEVQFLVTISNHKIPYNNVSPLTVQQLTSSERDEYVRTGREMCNYYD